MFEKKYRELMLDVKPDEALVEAMVGQQSQSKKVIRFPRAVKEVAAVLCGLIVLAGGTVAVDAATGGAIRKYFITPASFKDGTYVTEFDEAQLTEKNHYTKTWVDENGEEVVLYVLKNEESQIFELDLGFVRLSVELMPLELETEDVYPWKVYHAMSNAILMSYEKNGWERGPKGDEKIARNLELNLEKIDRSTEFGEACALGVECVIEDFRENRNCKVLALKIWDGMYDEYGREKILGFSYVRADLDEWKRETEENGTTEFIVEADGGVKKTYKIKVSSYSPFEYTYEPVE